MSIDREKISPMMKQYFEVKDKYLDCILFYRLGDFYEMFFDDAVEGSDLLGLTLTGRDCGLESKAPMCGVPFHSAQNYIDRLISLGKKVAICEQTEDAKATKTLVKREVVRVITAGTITSDTQLDAKLNNFLVAINVFGKNVGLASVDITTGQMLCTEVDIASLNSEIARFNPSEILIPDGLLKDDDLINMLKNCFGCCITSASEIAFNNYNAKNSIKVQFGDNAIELSENVAGCVGALLFYLQQTQMQLMPHIQNLEFYNRSAYMQIDYSSKRNLEIFQTARDGKKKGSLVAAIDKTITPMGGRLLRFWLDRPLLSVEEINLRQKYVNEFYYNPMMCDEIREVFKGIRDIERLNAKIVTKSANPRDLIALKETLKKAGEFKKALSGGVLNGEIHVIADGLDLFEDVVFDLERAIIDEPPVSTKDGGIIKDSYNEEVDKNRYAVENSMEWLAEYESKERERTGIKNLKVAYNKIVGYYIEVSKINSKLVPENYTQKGTYTNANRYITGELKQMENSILGAKERNNQLELEIYNLLLEKLTLFSNRFLTFSSKIAEIDVFASFAKQALIAGYVCPKMNGSDKIVIKNGRHPVVERILSGGEFVPNDAYISRDERMIIITGPNMAGKSTFMRQTALICLLAQIGSFVPASSAEIGIIDKIFTRVGASDDLAMGQSTFMVEMMEVANILDNSTEKSLVILDEIGRGTSTYDGLAIAMAVAEHLALKIKAKTLFATHYHEMTALEGAIEGAKNYSVVAEKRGNTIVFLRKIVAGGTDDSYGIEVAKLAGVCDDVVKRANEIVEKLEGEGNDKRITAECC